MPRMIEREHHPAYRLPHPWEEALAGWDTWLTAAAASAHTRKTRRSQIRAIARRLGAPHPRDVTEADLVREVGAPRYSPEHRRGQRAALIGFYRWCVRAGVVAHNPAEGLPVVRVPLPAARPATDTIWRDLLAAAREPRVILMARLAAEAGLRRAEVAAAHTDDLYDTTGGPELIVHGKGGKQRVVPITVSLADAIRTACPDGGWVFPGAIDGHLSADRVGHLVSALMPPGWSMHKLRHRFATRGYAGTGNLRAVQEALGHASVATTQRYTAVSRDEIRRVAEAAAAAAVSAFSTRAAG